MIILLIILPSLDIQLLYGQTASAIGFFIFLGIVFGSYFLMLYIVDNYLEYFDFLSFGIPRKTQGKKVVFKYYIYFGGALVFAILTFMVMLSQPLNFYNTQNFETQISSNLNALDAALIVFSSIVLIVISLIPKENFNAIKKIIIIVNVLLFLGIFSAILGIVSIPYIVGNPNIAIVNHTTYNATVIGTNEIGIFINQTVINNRFFINSSPPIILTEIAILLDYVSFAIVLFLYDISPSRRRH